MFRGRYLGWDPKNMVENRFGLCKGEPVYRICKYMLLTQVLSIFFRCLEQAEMVGISTGNSIPDPVLTELVFQFISRSLF